jgi:hypothetical protein
MNLNLLLVLHIGSAYEKNPPKFARKTFNKTFTDCFFSSAPGLPMFFGHDTQYTIQKLFCNTIFISYLYDTGNPVDTFDTFNDVVPLIL